MENLKDRLKKQKEEIKSRGEMGDIVFLKDGDTRRLRILNVGEENEFVKEVDHFYLGQDIKGVISPATFGEPCAIMEGFEELKNSSEDNDKEIASKFSPRKRYLAFCVFYKDGKGKEVDDRLSPRFILLTSGVYQEIIDLYLDEDEWGDMTDPIKGYDLKISRSGKGLTDTEYSVKPCIHTKSPKEYRDKEYDLDEEVKKIMPTYEETKTLLNKYLGLDNGGKKKKGKKKVVKKKKSDAD